MNQNLIELLSEFNDHHAEYLVVGAHALAVYGYVRATKDLDIWVRPTSDNAEKVFRALAEFGAPIIDLSIADLAEPDITIQIGVEPVRVDVLTSVSGVDFDPAWSRRHRSQLGESASGLSLARILLSTSELQGEFKTWQTSNASKNCRRRISGSDLISLV